MIDSREKLVAWLEGRPREYSQVIAARYALRILPDALLPLVDDSAIIYSLSLFRATAISWAACNFQTDVMMNAVARSAAAAANVADAISHSSNANVLVRSVAEAAYATAYATASVDYAHTFESWYNIAADCDWLDNTSEYSTAAHRLMREPISQRTSTFWLQDKNDALNYLLDLDPSYEVWTDWYNRRVKGNLSSFDIPGDTDRIEDKKIIRRLADATDEDFWDKGATYVNTTLQGWIDEARERVSPLPEQDSISINYGVNDRGQLDRLPAHDQKHLRDTAVQQQIYSNVRDAALKLQGEGQQRLGPRLYPALSKFIDSMPETFGSASAYPIWRDGNALRRLYRAHSISFESRELSSDQLEPVIAEGLGGLLDLYNHFAFGDDGLRAKDQASLPPQERANAESFADVYAEATQSESEASDSKGVTARVKRQFTTLTNYIGNWITLIVSWFDISTLFQESSHATHSFEVSQIDDLSAEKPQSISLFFATCRETDVDGTEYFTHRRAGECTYGIANVHVPIERSFGSLRRPHKISIFSINLFEMPENARTHFIINDVKTMPIEEWRKLIDNFNNDEALIFVHGFNMTFRDGLYRAAQIFHDLQYGGIPILFSWASGGRKADYLYDKDSANVGEKYLIELLAEVASTGIKKVHILAHSMGNALVIAALEKHNHKDNPLGIVELMMAAPDVDCDVYGQKMPALCKAISGLTLYASATDNALALSKTLARNKMRAGDISNGQPVLIEGVDAIDITEIGSEIFGLGHGAYASTPSILNDIGQLVNHRQRPPSKRLSQIRGMPEGATTPKWWKFVG